MKSPTKRWKRWLCGGLLAAVVLGGGYYGARHYAWPTFKAWRIERINREARAFLASGWRVERRRDKPTVSSAWGPGHLALGEEM